MAIDLEHMGTNKSHKIEIKKVVDDPENKILFIGYIDNQMKPWIISKFNDEESRFFFMKGLESMLNDHPELFINKNQDN